MGCKQGLQMDEDSSMEQKTWQVYSFWKRSQGWWSWCMCSLCQGALDMKYKTAATAMVPIADVYMISLDARLDHETMAEVSL